MEAIKSRILKTEQLDISELTAFQGKAKVLTESTFNKLRKSLIDEGFSFTVHVWEHGGKKWIIDGHQRVAVMRNLQEQGYSLPLVNCTFIEADDFKHAKKLVLLAISQYGKLDKDGFLDFIGDDKFDFDDFDFPDFKFDEEEEFEFKPPSDGESEPRETNIVIMIDREEAKEDLFKELVDRGYKVKLQ